MVHSNRRKEVTRGLKPLVNTTVASVCLLNDTAVTESFTRNLAKRYKIRNRQLEALCKIEKTNENQTKTRYTC